MPADETNGLAPVIGPPTGRWRQDLVAKVSGTPNAAHVRVLSFGPVRFRRVSADRPLTEVRIVAHGHGIRLFSQQRGASYPLCAALAARSELSQQAHRPPSRSAHAASPGDLSSTTERHTPHILTRPHLRLADVGQAHLRVRVDPETATVLARQLRLRRAPPEPKWNPSVHINEQALQSSIQQLRQAPCEADLVRAMARIVGSVNQLFGYSGAGVMFITDSGRLAYVAASDDGGRALEEAQEATGYGPCYESYIYARPVTSKDLHSDGRWPRLPARLPENVRAVAGVPIPLGGTPVCDDCLQPAAQAVPRCSPPRRRRRR